MFSLSLPQPQLCLFLSSDEVLTLAHSIPWGWEIFIHIQRRPSLIQIKGKPHIHWGRRLTLHQFCTSLGSSAEDLPSHPASCTDPIPLLTGKKMHIASPHSLWRVSSLLAVVVTKGITIISSVCWMPLSASAQVYLLQAKEVQDLSVLHYPRVTQHTHPTT